MENNKVSVIMPIHKYDDGMEDMVLRAVKSVPSDYFLYVINGNGEDNGESLSFIIKAHPYGLIVSPNSKKAERVVGTSFSCLINYAIEELKAMEYEWSYILVNDDEFNSLWFS